MRLAKSLEVNMHLKTQIEECQKGRGTIKESIR
jgi:hypothetical protein